jgi:DNA polymerase III subunit delta'
MSGTIRFAGLLGHRRTLQALSRALDENRLSPALIFHGPAGVGKLTAAVELARHLLCPSEDGKACGECDSCRRVNPGALLHPDLGLLFPQKKEDASEKSASEGPLAAPDLHSIQDEARNNASLRILADPARKRLSQLFLSPSVGRRRILLVLCADRLQEESGNAFLKVLEEPPSAAVLLLLCENISALLPTLRSRCQTFRFGTLSREDIARLLVSESGLPPAEAKVLASLSGGRIGSALSLARDAAGYRQRRSELSRLLGEARALGSAAAALSAAGEIETAESATLEDLAILSDLLRDAMLRGCGCPPSLLTDPATAADGSLPTLHPREAAALLVRLERAREDLRRYVNRQLALESLFLDLVKGPSRSSSPP